MEPLKWTTQQRRVKDLVPYNYNPRKLTEVKKQKLIASLQKFDLAEIPAINTDNIIIAGHQRVVVLMELGRGEDIIDVRVPSRKLSEAEFKEYNLRSNVSLGEWDVDLILKEFEEFDIASLGIELDQQLDEMMEDLPDEHQFEQDFNSIRGKPTYPIVSKFNEKYSAVLILAENTTDLTFLQTILHLDKERCYKSERVGQTFVLTTSKLQELWEKK